MHVQPVTTAGLVVIKSVLYVHYHAPLLHHQRCIIVVVSYLIVFFMTWHESQTVAASDQLFELILAMWERFVTQRWQVS